MERVSRLSEKKRTLIFICVVINCIATSFLATALTTALPAIIKDLNITVVTGQWLTSGYSLVMAIMMPLTAFLITRFPTKKLFLSSLGIFILGLFLSIIANNFFVMMISRVLQACANGILSSMVQVILLTIYPVEKRGSVMGWYGLSVGAIPVIAPTIAGIIVDLFNWRAIFYISITVMIISFIFATAVFDDVLETNKKKFDITSFIMSAIAFGGITLGIGNVGTYGFVSLNVLGIFVIGCIAGILFAYRQFHINEPFLELRVFKNRNFTLSVIGSMLLYLVMMGSSVIMPLYVQSILGKTATISGLVMLPGSLIMAITSPFAGKLYDKFGIKKLFVTGSICMLISNISMFFITMQTPVWIASIYNIIRSVSIGCLMMPLVTWGVSNINSKLTAHGTALLTSLRTVAGAIGSAVFVSIMTITTKLNTTTLKENANIHGLNMAFLAMAFGTIILLGVAVFLVKDNSKESC